MMKGRPPKARPKPLATFEQSRDMYGFSVRPQHLQRYREYATIYKEEEAERSDRWEQFLTTVNENVSSVPCPDLASAELNHKRADSSEFEDSSETVSSSREPDELGADKLWGQLRKSLWAIERGASIRGRGLLSSQKEPVNGHIDTVNETILDYVEQNLSVPAGDKRAEGGEDAVDRGEIVHNGVVVTNSSVDNTKDPDSSRESEEGAGEDSEDEFCDATESTDILREGENTSPPKIVPVESPWEEELRSLVRGGVPMALRGELWQVFVGTKTRRVRGQYNALLTLLADGGDDSEGVSGILDAISSTEANHLVSKRGVLEKWASQIEKDLPRTFPGHPALDEDGRNTLRRLLTAYARHNPSVGYCQAMNFLAALVLLLMPEENAFWTLTAIVDDYFEGYYSERMVEAQVDQLVFEDLAREQFPKLVSHLDTLGVQVAWISGPWFLTIFVNVLPWESVLRVWDVLLYEGNRRMLFCTGLALMEIHAPALAATRDAGDAVALLQSMASATFDSSQLVLMACMGFQAVTETRLQGLRVKHRPTVIAALDERSTELHLWRNSNNVGAPKLPYLFGINGSGGTSALIKSTARVLVENGDNIRTPQVDDITLKQQVELNMRNHGSPVEGLAQQTHTDNIGARLDQEDVDGSDVQEQIAWLKNELCRALEDKKAALEDKKAAILRAEELEAALVEIVKEDNRRFLSAKVEKLEAEVDALNHLLADKKEQEQAMVQVLVRMEQEQLIADDARRFAELDSAAQKRAAEVFQEKYESAADALAEMEKRAVMAESMLEATLSYQALGSSPHGSGSVCRSEPLLVRTPESAAGPPSLKETSSALTNYQNGSGTSSVHNSDEKANRQGIFNRPFGLNWRDRSKARSGNFDSPTRSPIRTLSDRAVNRAVDTDV